MVGAADANVAPACAHPTPTPATAHLALLLLQAADEAQETLQDHGRSQPASTKPCFLPASQEDVRSPGTNTHLSHHVSLRVLLVGRGRRGRLLGSTGWGAGELVGNGCVSGSFGQQEEGIAYHCVRVCELEGGRARPACSHRSVVLIRVGRRRHPSRLAACLSVLRSLLIMRIHRRRCDPTAHDLRCCPVQPHHQPCDPLHGERVRRHRPCAAAPSTLRNRRHTACKGGGVMLRAAAAAA